ncbi:hypothetical protein Tco_1226927 [Tanacetum coccineum]
MLCFQCYSNSYALSSIFSPTKRIALVASNCRFFGLWRMRDGDEKNEVNYESLKEYQQNIYAYENVRVHANIVVRYSGTLNPVVIAVSSTWETKKYEATPAPHYYLNSNIPKVHRILNMKLKSSNEIKKNNLKLELWSLSLLTYSANP